MSDEADQTRVQSYEFLGVDQKLAITLAKRDKRFEKLADEVEPVLETFKTIKKLFWLFVSGVITIASSTVYMTWSE